MPLFFNVSGAAGAGTVGLGVPAAATVQRCEAQHPKTKKKHARMRTVHSGDQKLRGSLRLSPNGEKINDNVSITLDVIPFLAITGARFWVVELLAPTILN